MALGLALFWVRLTGSVHLMDNDQERPASYVFDIVENGHWASPHDWSGDLSSKPPLHPWLSAILSLCNGGVTVWALLLPASIGMVGAALLVNWIGSKTFGAWAGVLASSAFLLSPSGFKLVALNRTDGLFVLTVTGVAVWAWRASQTGKGWIGFWLWAAAATLTKGPLGIWLGGLGLVHRLWTGPVERRGLRPSRAWVVGMVVYTCVVGVWLLWAVRSEGQEFLHRMVVQELVGHAVGSKYGAWGKGLVETPFYFVTRFLPWSPLALLGLWRTIRQPSAALAERRFERFLSCWIIGGLATLAMATHQRGDLVAPLLPPASLLAGRELAHLSFLTDDRIGRLRAAISVGSAIIALMIYQRVIVERQKLGRRSESVRQAAYAVVGARRPGEKLVLVDTPFALEVYLGQTYLRVPFEQAAARLVAGERVLVGVHDYLRLVGLLGSAANRAEVVPAISGFDDPWVRFVRLRSRNVRKLAEHGQEDAARRAR